MTFPVRRAAGSNRWRQIDTDCACRATTAKLISTRSTPRSSLQRATTWAPRRSGFPVVIPTHVAAKREDLGGSRTPFARTGRRARVHGAKEPGTEKDAM